MPRAHAETRLRRIRATRHTFERRARDIRVDNPGVLDLLFQDYGRATMEQDGRTATLNPGDLLLYDSSRPFGFRTAEEFGFTICPAAEAAASAAGEAAEGANRPGVLLTGGCRGRGGRAA